MRLTELTPRWFGISHKQQWNKEGPDVYFGLSFLCPCCMKNRFAVTFKPFIDTGNLADSVQWAWPGAPNPNTGEVKQVSFWSRTGDTFDTLTLQPSVNCTVEYPALPAFENEPAKPARTEQHWHGYITNGEVI